MIPLEQLTADVAAYLSEKLGVAAGNERPESPVYPCLVVQAEGKSCGTAVCGRQVERQVQVRVSCYPSRRRERAAGLALADRVYGLLAAGFPACGRGFHPTQADISCDTEERVQVTVLLEFYDLPQAAGNGGGSPEGAQMMGSLALRVDARKEEK